MPFYPPPPPPQLSRILQSIPHSYYSINYILSVQTLKPTKNLKKTYQTHCLQLPEPLFVKVFASCHTIIVPIYNKTFQCFFQYRLTKYSSCPAMSLSSLIKA